MITLERITQVQSKEDYEQIKQLYLSNGWIDAGDGDFEILINRIVSHTFCFVIARDEGRLIGMGRSLSDGVSDAYIQDVTVFPQYRKQGIGGRIISFLVEYMHGQGIGWIGLISEPGYESFYQGQGFQVMQGYTPFKYVRKT
jgi:GNAT superfamily N-acetyltransferase